MNNFRRIKSFVRREGRVTKRQQRAMDLLWSDRVVNIKERSFCDVIQRDSSVTLEIGFGMGGSLAKMAHEEAEETFIGVEVHRPGVAALLADMLEKNINNLIVINEDVTEVLAEWIPNESLNRVLILFPDPWPKKRHHKRRLIQPAFISTLAPKLKSQGILHLATDWQPYADHMGDVMHGAEDFRVLGKNDYDRYPLKKRLTTKFEQRGERLGHTITDIISVKK